MPGRVLVVQHVPHSSLGVPELHLRRDAVGAGTPVWGTCFGAQLLASALGGRVLKGPRPEVSVLPLRLTVAAAGDPVFGSLPAVNGIARTPMHAWRDVAEAT